MTQHEDLSPLMDEARDLVDAARRIVVLSGAGISTDSGIPDFRGPKGLWTRDPEAEKLSSITHYVADPEIRKKSWLKRLDSPAWTADPNVGHEAIVRLDRRRRLDLLVTQNTDGLHHESGLDPDRIVEIHGAARDTECLGCGDRRPMRESLDRVRAGEVDPPCLLCGGILKSATISFGQGLVEADLRRSFEAADACDLLVAVGTTLGVFPIANMVPIAHQAGSPIVIVNGSPTEMDHLATLVIRGPIGEVLPAICASNG